MTVTTRANQPVEQNKAWLKAEHPDWSIVYSSAGRWWGFLDASKRGKDAVPTRTTYAEADTPEELDTKLTKAES